MNEIKENCEPKQTIYAPRLGDGVEDWYDLCDDGLYHWHGIENLAGYTAEELEDR